MMLQWTLSCRLRLELLGQSSMYGRKMGGLHSAQVYNLNYLIYGYTAFQSHGLGLAGLNAVW